MKRKYQFFLILLICLILTGCKAEYTLTYKNNNFSEEVIFFDIESMENNKFSRYYQNSPDTKYDEENYYNIEEDSSQKKIYYYDIGQKPVKTRLISYCFEDLYVIDKNDYFDIESSGENYCKDYDLTIKFKTDKYVYDHNATTVSNGEYTWKNTDDGIRLIVSKKETIKNQIKEENKISNSISIFKIILSIIIIVTFVITYCYNKKMKKQKNEI